MERQIPPEKLKPDRQAGITLEDVRPDWTRTCKDCGATPIVPVTELCGVCTWNDPACAGGNW